MKWTMTMESDGFGFKFTVDNDGKVIVARAASVHECLYAMSRKIRTHHRSGGTTSSVVNEIETENDD